jgi:hypothetical protein
MTTEIRRESLADTFAADHERAVLALRNHGRVGLDAVVILSAHLMASERVLQPEVRRQTRDTTALLEAHARIDRRLQRALRALEQISAGDTFASQLDEGKVRSRLLQLVDEHSVSEARLVDSLALGLGGERETALTQRYHHLMQHGPTRPHPHTPWRGPLARLGYAFDSFRDRVLDVMDARSRPLPREATLPVNPGRWGHYVLGTMAPEDERDEKPSAPDGTYPRS